MRLIVLAVMENYKYLTQIWHFYKYVSIIVRNIDRQTQYIRPHSAVISEYICALNLQLVIRIGSTITNFFDTSLKLQQLQQYPQ